MNEINWKNKMIEINWIHAALLFTLWIVRSWKRYRVFNAANLISSQFCQFILQFYLITLAWVNELGGAANFGISLPYFAARREKEGKPPTHSIKFVLFDFNAAGHSYFLFLGFNWIKLIPKFDSPAPSSTFKSPFLFTS